MTLFNFSFRSPLYCYEAQAELWKLGISSGWDHVIKCRDAMCASMFYVSRV